MPDQLPELFDRLRQADVPVPPPAAVATRGRQRRRRARVGMGAAAVAVIAVTGLVARAVAVPSAAGRPASTPTARTAPPPAGSGSLILGLNASGRFVLTRTGTGSQAVVLPGPPSLKGGPALIATDPAGGWVITYSVTPKAPYGSQTARLALVAPNGMTIGFGPAFTGKAVTSVAVSPDGVRVAVTLTGGGKAAIVVMPTLGNTGPTRSWTVPAPYNSADNLSWSPDGNELTYAVGIQTGAGIDGYPVTLDIAQPGSVAPHQSGWPRDAKAGCIADVGAWLGTSGRFAALEECGASRTELLQPADASDGATTGPAVTIPGAQPGCGGARLDSAPVGNPILITYCGLYLDNHGTITKLPDGLITAALAG